MAKQFRHKGLLGALMIVGCIFFATTLIMLSYVITVSQQYSQALLNIQRLESQNQVVADTYIQSLQKSASVSSVCETEKILGILDQFSGTYIQQEQISPTITNCRVFENIDKKFDTDLVSIVIKTSEDKTQTQDLLNDYVKDKRMQTQGNVYVTEDGLEKVFLGNDEFVSVRLLENNSKSSSIFNKVSSVIVSSTN